MNERKYLLGLLSDKQQRKIEETYFANAQQFEKMLAAEDELVEAYINDELSTKEKKQFDAHLLSLLKWQQQVATVKALKEVVDEQKVTARPVQAETFSVFLERAREWWASLFPPKRIFALSYAVMVLFVVTASFYTARNVRNMQGQLSDLEQQNLVLRHNESELRSELQEQTTRTNEVVATLEKERQQRQLLNEQQGTAQRTPIPTFYLQPGLQRDATEQKRLLLPNAESIRLELLAEFQLDYKSYRVVLKTVSGDEVWSTTRLNAANVQENQAIMLQLPTNLLRHEDYLLSLSGVRQNGEVETIHTYFFSALE